MIWQSGRAGGGGGVGLVIVLAGVGGGVRLEGRGGRWMTARVVHTDEADRRIVELCDALAGIRYAHPRMMQLRMELEVEEEMVLLGAMGG